MKDKLTQKELESWLWESANILRGKIDSSEYKTYIFGLLFLKRLNDVFEERREEVVDYYVSEAGKSKAEAEKLAESIKDEYHFFVPERARWENLSAKTHDIGSSINKAMEALEEENPQIEGVLVSIDYNDKKRLPDAVLSDLLTHFSKHRIGNNEISDPDLLGRAYEYLIKQFADDAGKKGGEFYTPKEVVRALVGMVDPQEGMRICDPCCGSGGMLIESYYHVREKGGNPKNLSLFGQENNVGTWAICKMNMLLHQIPDARIERGDTFLDPKLTKGGDLMVFDRVIANPPWNQDWDKKRLSKGDQYNRLVYGIPPKSYGDWVWIQHMLATLDKEGMLGIVLDNGALFRGNSEGKIRKKVLDRDLIEAVIALPEKLFYNTGSPGCLIVFNKDKPKERKNKVSFIYAAEDYEDAKAQNFLRDKDIEKIVSTFRNFEDKERYSRVVDLEEIEKNNFNLNVTRYVDISEPEEQIDVAEALEDLEAAEEEREAAKAKVEGFMRELGYE